MTKEELEKEAEDNKPPYAFCAIDTKCELWRDGYIKGAEPREKQIQIDAEQIRALQKQNGELTDKVKELEAQIEKMKWHNLLKDPTDVPQNKRRVWCITSDGSKEGFYDKERKTPWVIGSSYWSTITAWCELPEWEEKK